MPTSNFQPIRLLDPDCSYKYTYLMTNSADPDQKPTDLDLHCLLRQGMSYSAREGLILSMLGKIFSRSHFEIFFLFFPENRLRVQPRRQFCLKSQSLFSEKKFVCVEVLRPRHLIGVMSNAVSFSEVCLPNHTFLGRLSPLWLTSACAYSFAKNWQLPLNQRKEENDQRKYFTINLHERKLLE